MTTLREFAAKIHFETEGHEELEGLSEQLEKIHQKVEFLAGAELVKGLYELAERFSGVGEQLESASAAAGMTTDRFQQLAFAASQNAVSQDELGGALARFSRVLGSARDGSKEAIAQFAQVGIGREQIAGFADAGDAMMALSDKVKDIQDPIKRTQVLMGLLGRGSANMTKLLAQGGAGIRDKMHQAGQIGAIVSAENIEHLANMEDAVSALGGVFKAAAANMAGYFAPAIIETVHRVQEFWVANHRVIEENFERWADKAAFALGFVVGLLEGTGRALVDFAKKHGVLVNAIAAVIFRFLEFKAATGVLGAGFTALSYPFKQVGEAIGFINSGLTLFKTLKPQVIAAIAKIGPALSGAMGWFGSLGLGPQLAILGALVVLGHDLYILFTTGNVEDMWLYKLIMAIKSLSIGALKKLGLYSPEDDGKKAAMDMPLAAVVPGAAPLARSMDFSGNANPDLAGFAANLGDLQHAQNMPPMALARNAYDQSANPQFTYNVDAPITVNVPANADPKAVAMAAQAGVTSQLDSMLRDAHTNQKQALVY